MTNEELLSKTISSLRFPLTIGIVYIHFNLASGLAIHGAKYGLDNPDWYFILMNYISEVIARIGVPLFFIISGFLFFYGTEFDGDVYKKKLKSRVKSLLIPYFLWNMIAILWKLKYFIPGISSFYRPMEVHFSLVRVLNTFFCNTGNGGIIVSPFDTSPLRSIAPIDVPLWYVRDLIVMVVMTPVIFYFIRRWGRRFLLIAGLVWYVIPFSFPNIGYASYFITAFFFFSLGAFLSISKKNMVVSFRKFEYAPYIYIIISLLDVMTKSWEFNELIHKLGIIVGVLAAVNIVSYFLESNKISNNTKLANSSFFIFALHNIIIGDIGKFIFMKLQIPDDNPWAMISLYFGVPIFCVFICLLLYRIIKKYMPRLCALLTGGRQ